MIKKKIQKASKILFNIFKLFVSIVLLYYVFKKIDLLQFYSIFKKINIFYISLYFFSALILFPLMAAYRWYYALKISAINIKFYKLFQYTYVSYFSQLFIPSSFVSEIVKGYYLAKKNSKSRIINSILVPKLVGLLALFLLAAIGIFFLNPEFKLIYKFRYFPGIFLILMILAVILFLNSRHISKKLMRNNLIKFIFTKTKLVYIFENSHLYNNSRIMTIIITSAVIHQLIPVLHMYFICQSLSVNISIFFFALIIPISTFLTMLPISFAGFGLQEGFLYYFLKYINIPSSIIYNIILLLLLIKILRMVIGSILFLVTKRD